MWIKFAISYKLMIWEDLGRKIVGKNERQTDRRKSVLNKLKEGIQKTVKEPYYWD